MVSLQILIKKVTNPALFLRIAPVYLSSFLSCDLVQIDMFVGFVVRKTHLYKEPHMQVTIDGVQYAPVNNSHYTICIAITTHNRPEILKCAIDQHMKHLPFGALVDHADGELPDSALRTERRRVWRLA